MRALRTKNALSIVVILFVAALSLAKKHLDVNEVLEEPTFLRFLTLATHNKRLDLVVTKEYLDENGDVLKMFVQSVPLAIRISTNKHGFCRSSYSCLEVFQKPSTLLLILHKREVRTAVLTSIRYINSIVLLSKDLISLQNSTVDRTFFRDPHNSILLENGVSNIFSNGSAVFLLKDFKIECLTCGGSSRREKRLSRIFRQISFNGTKLKVYCEYPEDCAHPAHHRLVEILRHKNAWVRERVRPAGLSQTNEIIDNFLRIFSSEYPRIFPPYYFHTLSLTFYARRRNPLPKEMVLVLPFSWQVWTALLACLVMSVLSLSFICRVQQRVVPNIYLVVFSLVASLLQQSSELPWALRRSFRPKLVLILWGILGIVTATGYKGSLTSLLRNIPLEGKIPKFLNWGDAFKQKYRKIRVPTYILRENYSDSVDEFVSLTSRLFKEVIPGREGSTLIFYDCLFQGPHTELVRQTLYDLDFVPTGDPVNLYVTGAEIMAASPFVQALKNATSQALEAGLFDRAESLELYKINFRVHSAKAPALEDELTVSDLKPFFVILLTGLGVSALTLVVEYLVCFLPVISAKMAVLKHLLSQRARAMFRWLQQSPGLFQRFWHVFVLSRQRENVHG